MKLTELLVLNEASLPFESLEDCNKNIDSIFDILHEARLGNLSFCRVDGFEGNWGELNYANEFEFGRWLNEISDQDKVRQVKSVLTSVKCPLRTPADSHDASEFENMIFVLESDSSLELMGLGYAHLLDKYSFSFASGKVWLDDVIPIVKMTEADGNSSIEESVAVNNIASKEQLLVYLKELEKSRKESRDFLSNLVTKDNEYFPNLLFTESALKAFRASTMQSDDFQRVVDVLEKLDKAIVCSANLAELSEQSGLSITGESSSTMSNRVLVRMRTFKHPDKGKLVFEDHVKNFPNAKRMHIWTDYHSNKICIGYFGTHLKTSNS